MCAVMSNKTTKTTIGNIVSETIIEYFRMPIKFDIQKKLYKYCKLYIFEKNFEKKATCYEIRKQQF